MLLVTGGAGFIGSYIVAEAEARGVGPIAICDRLGQRGKWRNIAKRAFVDVVKPDSLFEWLAAHGRRLRAVIHMGAVTTTTETDGDRTFDVNVKLSQRLWHWCAEARVPLIYASSAATYGDGRLGFDDDPDPAALARLHPLNLYGWSKHAFDRWVIATLGANGPSPPQWAGLKFFNVYGPNEYHKGEQGSIIHKFYPDVAAGRPVKLFRSHDPAYADGAQLRDFVWVGDCADVVLWLVENSHVCGLLNCGTGRARTFADLAKALFRSTNREPKMEFVAMPDAIRPQYQYFTEARLERLRATGYDRPFTSLEDGVHTYVRDFLDTGDPYR